MCGINKSINYPSKCKFLNESEGLCEFSEDSFDKGVRCNTEAMLDCDILLTFQYFYTVGFKDGERKERQKDSDLTRFGEGVIYK